VERAQARVTVAIQPDDAATGLLAPVDDVLRTGLAVLASDGTFAVTVGPVGGFWRRDGDVITLSDGLLRVDLQHPSEGPHWPLDRWRRAAASVLEAVASAALPGISDRPAWVAAGLAVDLADRACPALRLADPDVASAIGGGDLVAAPRGGVAVARAWRTRGIDPLVRAREAIDPAEWLAIGRWVFDVTGAAAALPGPVPHVADVDVPLDLGPWRWQPLAVPAHPRGGEIVVSGGVAVGEAWAVARRVHRTIAASTTGGRLSTAAGGPVGRWEVKSAQGYGQVYGARGLVYVFKASGALELELADAFVGPLRAAEAAEHVGTSGTASGEWRVAGPHLVRFDRITPQNLTMHGHGREKFKLPADAFGMGPMLQAMQEDVWAWSTDGDQLSLRGTIMGGSVEVRLRRTE
jgi:hypothetical protein